jgi:hypothetical protein
MPATSSTIDGQGKIRSFTSFSDLADYLLAHGVIVQTPGEDVVEVVRCKDCKYFEKDDEFDMTGFCTCERITKNYGGEIYPYEDDFCSYGKRKEQP